MPEMDNNSESLRKISRKHSKSIPQLLSDIQRCQSTQQKDVRILKRLDCLHISKRQRAAACQSIASFNDSKSVRLSRRQIDTSEESNYIALSYTWTTSEHENNISGAYKVQGSSGRIFRPSPVQASIFDRIIRYMDATDVDLLWIDRHCIDQDTCDEEMCTCGRCDRKARALQAMDLVYSRSSHPVALLSRPVTSYNELKLLADIMQNKFKARNKSMVGPGSKRAYGALHLLRLMTNDPWWTRAWTYQENYRAGVAMMLLIPHSSDVEGWKHLIETSMSHYIEGEIAIKSVDFMKAATLFCEEYKQAKYRLTKMERGAIEGILSKAAKYTALLEPDAFMFPTVISDLSKRELERPWDLLAVIANCCQYSFYLDTQKLFQKGASRNLSILAMCLINGEILNNSFSGPRGVSEMTVVKYLKELCLPSFAAPPDRDLTYRKGCRFHSVSLSEAGIKTEGHLWELGDVIDTRDLWKPSRDAHPMFKNERFSEEEVDQLATLTDELEGCWKIPLADGIKRLLRSGYTDEKTTFARGHMEAMAKEVARAVAEGQQLRLGRLCSKRDPRPDTAIFLSNEKWSDRLSEKEYQGYVFTSSSERKDENDVHRHVCLDVSWKGSDYEIPQL